ncbi:MAG: hypothetical protein IJH04_05540 [Eggerthellaceae bacterium]|nr:hypothetical protein [Eggerthellaceae bacterium]
MLVAKLNMKDNHPCRGCAYLRKWFEVITIGDNEFLSEAQYECLRGGKCAERCADYKRNGGRMKR